MPDKEKDGPKTRGVEVNLEELGVIPRQKKGGKTGPLKRKTSPRVGKDPTETLGYARLHN